MPAADEFRRQAKRITAFLLTAFLRRDLKRLGPRISSTLGPSGMARKLHGEYLGAVYHGMHRGEVPGNNSKGSDERAYLKTMTGSLYGKINPAFRKGFRSHRVAAGSTCRVKLPALQTFNSPQLSSFQHPANKKTGGPLRVRRFE
jgi:hypothetical protein